MGPLFSLCQLRHVFLIQGITYVHNGGVLEMNDEGPNERFERRAEEFYKDTGFMAPGKDQATASHGDAYEVRHGAWEVWCIMKYKAEELESASTKESSPDTTRIAREYIDKLEKENTKLLTALETQNREVFRIRDVLRKLTVETTPIPEIAINIILDESESQSPIFVEIENDKGESIGIGTREPYDGGLTKLRICISDILNNPGT